MSQSEPTADAVKRKVLVIDDDIAFNEILKEQLEWTGFEVKSAFDGGQGMALYHQYQPDIVITDIIMPNTDGIEVILSLVNDDNCNAQIVVMSGGGRIAGVEYLRLTENLGIKNVLEKPFSFSQLEEILDIIN